MKKLTILEFDEIFLRNPTTRFVLSSKIFRFATCTIATIYRFALFRQNSNLLGFYRKIFWSTYVLEEEPQTFKEAMNSTEGLMWKEAIESEIDFILHNHIWELVDLPPDCKPLNSK